MGEVMHWIGFGLVFAAFVFSSWEAWRWRRVAGELTVVAEAWRDRCHRLEEQEPAHPGGTPRRQPRARL